jgi:hypothetical protein
MKVATYNVISLPPARQHQLVMGCNKWSIDVVAIQEHRQMYESELHYQQMEGYKLVDYGIGI